MHSTPTSRPGTSGDDYHTGPAGPAGPDWVPGYRSTGVAGLNSPSRPLHVNVKEVWEEPWTRDPREVRSTSEDVAVLAPPAPIPEQASDFSSQKYDAQSKADITEKQIF